jgi:hypothetical protein
MAQATVYSQIRDIANDNTGDFLFSSSSAGLDLQFIGDAPALVQAVNNYILSFAGEWFLNTADGIAYWPGTISANGTAIGKGVTAQALQAIIRQGILSVDGMVSVTSITTAIDPRTRNATITWAGTGSVPVVPLTGTIGPVPIPAQV